MYTLKPTYVPPHTHSLLLTYINKYIYTYIHGDNDIHTHTHKYTQHTRTHTHTHITYNGYIHTIHSYTYIPTHAQANIFMCKQIQLLITSIHIIIHLLQHIHKRGVLSMMINGNM